ncbi:MFS transporter [Paraburkholderia sp. DHOC27]|uniref:MFS transporter n=1 Tax=Paraburkholderia sp. DHOC27 TaxID=2303330 RepID=UPI000E3D0B52|nr:MFS transporter [Paraburkholderia sp. DHOC27]RFU48515.1 MFS transporter [Paraburkholderia sp. DHOC27]
MLNDHRRFYTFLAGSFCASIGGWINFLAILNLATYRFDARPFDLVVLSAALLVPPILLTRVISKVCERHASTRVLVSALALTLLTTAALLWIGNFPAFLAVVALKSAALGFTDPAETTYVTSCIEDAQQSRAFRLLNLAQSMAKICAPAAGGLVAAWAGDNQTVQVSLVFIAVAIVLIAASNVRGRGAWARGASTTQAASAEANQPANPRATFTGAIVPLLLCVGTSFALGAAVNNQFPLMLRNQGFAKSVLGTVVSCSALGGVLGSLLPTGRSARRTELGALLFPALVTSGVFVAIGGIFRLPLWPGECLLALAFFMTGLVGARFRIACRLFIAERLADQVASASAAMQSTGMFMQFVAPCFGALLSSLLSTSAVFVVLGTLSAVSLAAVALRYGLRRDADSVEPATSPVRADPATAVVSD